MKSDIVKVHQGNTIFPFGVPCVISTVWKEGNRYHTESYAILFCLDNTIEIAKSYDSIDEKSYDVVFGKKSSEAIALKRMFIHGYQLAEQNVPALMWKFAQRKYGNKSFPNPSVIELNLKYQKDSTVTVLVGIGRKDKEIFKYLEKTKCELLKGLLKLAKGFDGR